MGLTISHREVLGVHLSSASQNPVKVTATGAIETTDRSAIDGSAAVDWTVRNFGSVSGAKFGISLAGGGEIINGTATGAAAQPPKNDYTTVPASAVISGAIYGIVIKGIGLVANRGTLSGALYGVRLGDGGRIVNGSVGNPAALISSDYMGVRADGALATLANYGQIRTATSSPGFLHAGGMVFLSAGGSVVNGGVTDTAASIAGGSSGIGVNIGGAYGTVSNFGTISGFGGVELGYRADSGGSVTNGSVGDAAAIIEGQYGVGVNILSGVGTVVNYGTIAASGSFGLGVQLAAGTLRNAGTIIGSGGAAVLFAAGDDKVVVSPGAVFIGGVTASSTGANTLELAAGSRFGVLGGIGGKFRDFGTVSVDAGARWRLSGTNSLAGGSTISDNGVLLAKGDIAVGGDLTLSGTGVMAVMSTGEIEVGAKGHAALGQLVVDGGRTLVGTGTISGPITVSGELRASGGTLTLASNPAGHGILGAGAVEIDSGAVLVARNDVGVQRAIFLAGTNEELALARPGRVISTISGFGATDTIDLLNITTMGTGSFANGTLALTTSASGHIGLRFAGSYANGFAIGGDGHGGTAITLHG